MLVGLVTAGICNLSIAASLAEFLSAYPTYVSLFLGSVSETVLMMDAELEDNITGLQVC